jgi:hypothetical protein
MREVPRFKSRSWDRSSWLRIFVDLLSRSRQIPERYPKFAHDNFLSHPFPFIIQRSSYRSTLCSVKHGPFRSEGRLERWQRNRVNWAQEVACWLLTNSVCVCVYCSLYGVDGLRQADALLLSLRRQHSSCALMESESLLNFLGYTQTPIMGK